MVTTDYCSVKPESAKEAVHRRGPGGQGRNVKVFSPLGPIWTVFVFPSKDV